MATEEIPEDLDEMSWSEIQSVVSKVKTQLDNSSDGATDQLLQERLAEAEEALAEYESRQDEPGQNTEVSPRGDTGAADATPEPIEAEPEVDTSIDDLLAELLVDDDDRDDHHNGKDRDHGRGRDHAHQDVTEDAASELDPEVVEAAIITARGKPRARPSPTGPRNPEPHAVARRPNGPHQPVGPDVAARQVPTAWWVAGAFVLTALAGTIGFLLIGSGDAPEDGTVESAAAPASELDEFKEVLDVLDAGGLDVSREGSVLRISGTVTSSDQLEIVRDTAAVMVDYDELDTSGVTIDEPLVVVAGESATATESERSEPKLQQDLDRLLRTTPIMFEAGESELAELDRRILNAAVVLILSVPEAAITITGHPDETGDGDLATARATTVRDYLIVRGVDPETLSSTGESTLAPDGAPGVIELTVDP